MSSQSNKSSKLKGDSEKSKDSDTNSIDSTSTNATPTSTNTAASTRISINSNITNIVPLANSLNQSVYLENTSKISLTYLPVENSIITVIFSRIDLLLPYISGYSIPQVLAEPTYLQAKNHLLKLASTKHYLHDLIACVYNLLIKIVKNDSADSLYDKSLTTLNSIYLIISLLSNFLNTLKAHENLDYSASRIFKSVGMKITSFSLVDSHLTSKPSLSLNGEMAQKLLKLLLSLKTDQNCLQTITSLTDSAITSPNPTTNNNITTIDSLTNSSLPSSLSTTNSMPIPNSPPTSPSLQNHSTFLSPQQSSTGNNTSSTTSSSNMSSTTSSASFFNVEGNLNYVNPTMVDDHNEAKALLKKKTAMKNSNIVQSINTSIFSIFRYIAASNSDQYLLFTKSIFKRFPLEFLYIKGSHVLQFVYLSSTNFISYIQFIRELMHIAKRSSQKSLFLYYFSKSILSWALNRTEDFLKVVDSPVCSKNAEMLFDTIYKMMDSKYCPEAYYSIMSCLILFQPKILAKFIVDKSGKSTSQALKRSLSSVTKLISSRQKFLNDFIQLISNTPEFSQPLISFLLVGCSVSTYNKNHALYSFVLFMKDNLLKQLRMDTYDLNHTHQASSGSSTHSNSTSGNFSTNLSSISTNSSSTSTPSETEVHALKINQELRVGILAVSIVVNPMVLPDQLSHFLCSHKSPISSLTLFTGAFRLLVGIPSLSELSFRIVQDLTPTLIKILSLCCKTLTDPNKDSFVDAINESLNINLHMSTLSPVSPSSQRTSSFSSNDFTGTHLTKTKTPMSKSLKNNLKTPSSPATVGNGATVGTGVSGNIFKIAPLKLAYDDAILDSLSINSSESIISTESYNGYSYFRITDNVYGLKDHINYSTLKAEISKCHPLLLKENVINLLMVYSSYPFLCYVDVENGKEPPDSVIFEALFRKFLEKIVRLLYLNDEQLFEATKSLLESFCLTVSNIYPAKVYIAYIATGVLVDVVSEVGISPSITSSKRNRIIKLLFNLIETRSEHVDLKILFDNSELVSGVHTSGTCSRILRSFDRLIFLGLFSGNIETIRISKILLQFWVMKIRDPHHLETCFDKANVPLALDILADKMTFSLLTIRRKLRDHLSHLEKPTETLLGILSLMYEKVATSYDYEHSPDINSSDQEIDTFFANHTVDKDMEIYCEYIASLGGIIFSQEFKNDLRRPLLKRSMEKFLVNQFISLFCKAPNKREHAREILSISFHPYLAGLYLQYITLVLPRFQSNLDKGEYNICELFLSVLRSVCQLDSASLFTYSAQLWNINFALLKMLNIENNTPEFLRLKLKFCKLQVVFLGKLEDLALNGNILKKNDYARIAAAYLESAFSTETEQKPSERKVLSFLSSSSSSSSSKLSKNKSINKITNKIKEFKETELKDLLMDIKVEVSNMLKLIFYKLPLDTPKQSGSAEEDNSVENVVFSNYFSLFVRLLEKLHVNQQNEDSYTPVARRSSNVIKEIIQALINLLNSNSSVGLKYSLPLGYHNDELIRVSFIDVFSKIIQEIYSNYEKKISMEKLYAQQCEIFTSDYDLFLSAAACCPKYEIEAYANSILHLPVNEKIRLRLLLSLIRFDVINTTDKNEILRSNTVGTRVTALYSRDHATEYLKHMFRPIFQQMIDNQDFFEIEKVDNKSDAEKEENLQLFFKYLNMIADAIYRSIDHMPIGIRLIAKTIFDATTEVMPEIKYTSINAYLFLRLINPTIVSPEHAEIVECTNPLFKRSLIQLARVIQSMVNESPIRMSLLETKYDELSYSKKRFFTFMKDVVTFDISEAYNTISEFDEHFEAIEKSEHTDSNTYLHGFFYDNWMEIRDLYCTNSYSYGVSIADKIKNVRALDYILSSCGLPKRLKTYEIPEAVKNDKSSKGILLYDFMSRTSLFQDSDYIKVMFTKDGLPLICVNTLDFPEDITREIYLYNFLQTLAKFWEEPYCVLVDFTAFHDFHIITHARELIHAIFPTDYKANCKRIYYFNMSPLCLQEFKHFDSDFLGEDKSVNPEFVFLSTNDDSKTLNKNKLIGYKNSTTGDSRVTFHDVSIYQEDSKRFVPVKMRIGYNFIQIYPAMPIRIKIRDKMHVINPVDCYKITELDNIASSSYTGVANEISLTDMKTNRRIILTSPKKVEIMRTIYFSRAILNKNNYTEDDYVNGNNPKFIVGQLLNISFSGLLSRSADIRKASYALLSSVQHSVGLQTGKNIDNVEGVVFPYGNTDYVSAVSARIAENHPTLTYAFIYGFFSAFKSLNEEDKNSMVLCVSPWIKNIYQYVYLSNSVLGPGRTYDIIRKCVRASREQNQFQVFSLFMWPQLSLEDGLIDIIIDEIVAASIDHEAEGNDWQRITKYWPLRSSIEICSIIIKRMKEKSYKMTLTESDIEAHTRWIETTVLAKFLSFLIFDSLLFVDRYISDIFYIVTIYMDHGPLELRNCLIYLLSRTFHAYLAKPSLTLEQHELIKQKIELLNGARFRMLFGLTREDGDTKPNKLVGSDISGKANSVTTLCDLLTSFLQTFMEPEEYELQMINWNSCVCNVAFNNHAQLQSRAIVIMGALTKKGISSLLVVRFVTLLRTKVRNYFTLEKDNVDPHTLRLTVCTLHACGNAIIGIDNSSCFHPTIFWFHMFLLVSDDISFFRYGADFLKETVVSINEHLKDKANYSIVEYIFKGKEMLGDMFEQAENQLNFKLTTTNFDAVLSLLFCRGFESPYSYNYSVGALKALLKIRYAEHITNPDNKYIDYNCYLFFLFLTSSSNDEMDSTMEECGLSGIKYIMGVNNTKIPQLLLDWFETTTLNIYSVVLGAAKYFMKQKLDELSSTRVIALYVELYRVYPSLIMKLLRKSDGVLRKFISLSSTPSLLNTVLEMVVTIMSDPGYEVLPLERDYLLEKLRENHTLGVTAFAFDLINSSFESAENPVSKIRQKRIMAADKLMDKVMELYKRETDSY